MRSWDFGGDWRKYEIGLKIRNGFDVTIKMFQNIKNRPKPISRITTKLPSIKTVLLSCNSVKGSAQSTLYFLLFISNIEDYLLSKAFFLICAAISNTVIASVDSALSENFSAKAWFFEN